ncbi:unnamed protein product [Pylaiella littoralis]
MDPAKCLEILGNRGTCSGSHDASHGRADPTPSQAAAEIAATAVGSGSGSGGGQVINLTTGSNETCAAAEAASSLMATAVASPDGHGAAPSSNAAPYAESNGCGGCGGKGTTGNASGDEESNHDSGCADADAMHDTEGQEDGTTKTTAAAAHGCTATTGASAGTATAEGGEGGGEVGGVLKGMEGMSAAALVASFRRAQEERVALYRKFNEGLREALRSGDYSGYPALCCEVTAGFSVLSKAINAIEALLGADPETKPLAGIIRRVQGREQEKLTVTAAHHLESMRKARALGMGPGMTVHAGGAGDVGSESPAQERLLKDGVGDMLRRAEAEAAAVTELLEELRYEAEGL